MFQTANRNSPARVAIIVGILLGFMVLSGRVARAQDTQPEDETLRVVTKSIEPFVFTDDGPLRGFSIDLWTALAVEAGLRYEFEIVETVTDQIDEVADDGADVAIAAVTITEDRETRVDFTLPYFRSGLGILTRTGSQTQFLDAVRAAFTPNLWYLVGFILILLVIIGHIVWLIERKRNEQFDPGYVRGVGDGIWWAAVTVTTVGYGDRTPTTLAGRVLGLFWMFAGLFIIANFTAGVTASLTAEQLRSEINGPDDLAGHNVVAVRGSTADSWLIEQGIPHTRVIEIADAYPLLERGTVDAIVYDFPVLQYHTLTRNNEDLIMAGEIFAPELYGIVLPHDSPYRETLNRALLTLLEDGTYEIIYARWFGEGEGL